MGRQEEFGADISNYQSETEFEGPQHLMIGAYMEAEN